MQNASSDVLRFASNAMPANREFLSQFYSRLNIPTTFGNVSLHVHICQCLPDSSLISEETPELEACLSNRIFTMTG